MTTTGLHSFPASALVAKVPNVCCWWRQHNAAHLHAPLSQEHELPKRSLAVVYGVILVAGVGVYLAVLYLAQTATGNQYYARRSTF